MVPFEVGNNQQRQQVLPSAGMEIIPAKLPVNRQIQVVNKFAVLENEESDVDGANQVATVNTNNISSPNATSQVSGRSLNAAAPVFYPISNGKKTRKENNGIKDAVHIGEKSNGQGKESTAQWVSRTFAVNNVIMNQSCQEIPSQATDPEELAEHELLKQKVNWTGGRLWSNQTEEDPDEGDLSEGYKEEAVPVGEEQGEEISVSGNTNKGEGQTGEKTTETTHTSMEIVGSSSKLQRIDNSSNPIPITDGTTDPTSDPRVEEPIDPGDTGEGKEEQNAERSGDIEKENEVAAIDVQKNDQMQQIAEYKITWIQKDTRHSHTLTVDGYDYVTKGTTQETQDGKHIDVIHIQHY
ncbi:hypothetical protein A4A49_06560 [Nicotiana attenuata]|uniref:Uncharacterized protein n=1 Tax=Nicotiana attenuata TaxID=49451 RepID=A0A1J6HZ19_NICAT|nr:hypothetical protein A4A49_06560 [Nicotiana attenuata]